MTTKMIYLIKHDEPNTKYQSRYKYSDGLFDFVYSNLKYVGTIQEGFISSEEIDLVRTKNDHCDNGCRIWFKDGMYESFYECDFLFEFTFDQSKEIRIHEGATLEDVVNYYHKINNIDGRVDFRETKATSTNTELISCQFPLTKLSFLIQV